MTGKQLKKKELKTPHKTKNFFRTSSPHRNTRTHIYFNSPPTHKTCHFRLPSATTTIIIISCLLLIASTAEAQRGAPCTVSGLYTSLNLLCGTCSHTHKKATQQRQKEAESQVSCNPSATLLTTQPHTHSWFCPLLHKSWSDLKLLVCGLFFCCCFEWRLRLLQVH